MARSFIPNRIRESIDTPVRTSVILSVAALFTALLALVVAIGGRR